MMGRHGMGDKGVVKPEACQINRSGGDRLLDRRPRPLLLEGAVVESLTL